jgi:proton-translocating NADH-quinone oxidoreductase chain L
MMSHWQGWLYVAAVLIPLFACAVELLFIRALKRLNAYIATGAIGLSCLLSLVGLASAIAGGGFAGHHAEAQADAGGEAAEGHAAGGDHGTGHRGFAWTGSVDWVVIGAGMHALPDPPTAAPVPLPALSIPLAIHIDGLAVIMFSMVTFIATLIHVYSMGYMSDDPRYPRFFAYLSLFCFSMLGLVASANIFMVFMFWELVGVCSYLLIGFWYEDKKNTDAANKAFIVNRVGDVGMLVGLGLIWTYFGTFTIADINHGLSDKGLRDPHHMNRLVRATAGDDVTVHLPADSGAGEGEAAEHGTTRTIPYGLLVLAGLGIFAGCMGKSAQVPLHVWLPDAMAGPTPVSALIHAATMVAAGVYLVGRFFPLFTNEVLLTIGYTGGITLLIAATIAMVQTDYKKVLAYSTVSQLGFMILALGVGGWAAGLFHLLTHAFFKALLFLCAGSVYHSVHTYEMPVLGGLWKKMPTTGWCMLIGTLAISGVPLFSGFYSKDAILANALYFVRYSPANMLLFILPALGAIITAFYMFRMWFLIFDGEPRGYPARTEPVVEVEHGHFEAPAGDHGHDAAHSPAHGHDAAHGYGIHAVAAHGHDHGHHGNPVDHAHESPPIMTWPLIILAFCAVVVGYPVTLLPINIPVLEGMLEAGEPLAAQDVSDVKLLAMGASLLIAAGGIAAAVGYYSRWKIFNPARMADRLGWVYAVFAHKWYFDEIYDAVFVRPTLALARVVVAPFDKRIVDGMVNGSATATRGLSRFEGFFDKFAVDGLVNLVGWIVYALGDWGRGIQTGRLRSYLGLMAVAVVALFVGVFFWVR